MVGGLAVFVGLAIAVVLVFSSNPRNPSASREEPGRRNDGIVNAGQGEPMPSQPLDRAGRSNLHYAARDGDIATATRLTRAGEDVNLRDKHKYTPLHFAAQDQQPEMADFLLRSGAELEATDDNGNTPLFVAISHYRGDPKTAMLLRKWGANLHAKNHYGVSPLDVAKSLPDPTIAKALGQTE